MELKKRNEYLIFTFTFFCIGFVMYGGLAATGRELLGIQWNIILVILVYGLGGGCLIGILSFIPYEIYNFICIKRKTEK